MSTSKPSDTANSLGLTLATSAAVALLATVARAQCPADINVDGVVNGADLGFVLSSWGPCAGCSADLDGNDIVNGADLGTLLGAWGECSPTVPGWATLVEAAPDPDVVTDPALRAAIAATGLAWRVRDSATQVEMLLVPPGTFMMGCSEGSDLHGCFPWEQPVHQVTLTSAFYLARYELTQAEWQATMGSNPAYFQSASAQVPSGRVHERPVEGVSWNGVQGFLAASGLRLPTEAEWEFACRAGTSTPFYNGTTDDATLIGLAWCSSNADAQTRAVGGRTPNAFGFHDMLGNVWEWVSDRYSEYSADPQIDPTAHTGSAPPVLRGGSWYSDTRYTRSSMRLGESAVTQFRDVGFRVAKTP